MNWPHIHLMLNHAPVFGVLLALTLLLIGMFRDRSSLKEAAFITLVLTGALAAIVYYTGDAAGELLGGLPDISQADLLAHSSMALYALAGAVVSGLLALGALIVSRRSARTGTWFLALSLLLAAGTAFLMLQTANLGGRMRHPEARRRTSLDGRKAGYPVPLTAVSLSECEKPDGEADSAWGPIKSLKQKTARNS
jgi:uncharacterized membrane protein